MALPTDSEIGRVVAVDTAQVTIELNRDLKGMSRTTYEGPQEVGRINSYVVIPIGARRLVAIVTRVMLAEEAEMKADRTMIALPAARRLMKATLIGTIDGGKFRQGVSSFPVLDSPVLLAQRQDHDAIFGPAGTAVTPSDPRAPGFCIPIGESAVVQGRPIRIDPDAFFGKHAAVLGSTGSGKSCTIASLIQSILEHESVQRTTILILDTNGEYRSALMQQDESGEWQDPERWSCLYIPSDPGQSGAHLVIPYWFFNAEDFVRIFQASRGVQRPVLLEALRLARNETGGTVFRLALLREELVHELNRIWALSVKDERTSKDLRDLARGLKARIADSDLEDVWPEANQHFGIDKNQVVEALDRVANKASEHIEEDKYPKVIPADSRRAIGEAIEPIYEKLTGTHLGEAQAISGRSADAPSFFDKVRFRSRHLEQVLRREESGGARARDYSGTMLLRIDRLLADRRFEFLFGPVGEALPEADHVLAAFLRDVLGIGATQDGGLSSEEDVPPGRFPFYDRQRSGAKPANVVILDLSLLAAEVLENVTALVGRLILEFLQRLGEHGGGESPRGSLPVVLVLEEAQNYIQQPRFAEEESIARVVFERIAREGRKYGLSLVVASQRPSELSKTVLSQCSSFIVHRLQNPEDLRYFKEIVPGIYGPMLEQLPALAPQTALVLGECVAAPALVRIREAQPVPRSQDPMFWAHWTSLTSPDVPVEEVCAEWEVVDPTALAAAEQQANLSGGDATPGEGLRE
jgi:DNA helicase HerA-like ATPase